MTKSLRLAFEQPARFWPAFLFLPLLVGLVLFPASAKTASSNKANVVISGVYFDGHLKGNPEPEEAIRITNVGSTRVNVSGWRISNRYQSRAHRRQKDTSSKDNRWRGRYGKWRKKRRKSRVVSSPSDTPTDFFGAAGSRNVILPENISIPPKGSIWIAHKGRAFLRAFGKRPDIEAADTDPKIPNARLPEKGWPSFFATYGIVSLHNAQDDTIDVIPYVRRSFVDSLSHANIPKEHWKGPSVILKEANPYSWTGQVLARDRQTNGLPVPDTNTAADWNGSFSKTRLGRDTTHRVELPGQSLFTPKQYRNLKAEVLVTSAPENNYAALTRAFRRAKREILVNIYQFTNNSIATALVRAAKRGVRIELLMEGAPVAGVKQSSRYIAQRLVKNGAKVYWMRGIRKRKLIRRYRFNHAKYVIIDRKWVIIGTENYGSTGHPIHPSYGNRGWEVHVKQPKIVRDLLRVFRLDTNRARYNDLTFHDKNNPNNRWGAPRPDFRPRHKIKKGKYTLRRKPLLVKGTMDMQLVFSPDNSLHERGSIIGSILSCKKEVLIQQNSIRLYWGMKRDRSFKKTPSLPLMAVIEAARKGCRVRVMLDSTWYHITSSDPRGNDDTVKMLNTLARNENLDLQAKLINLDAVGVKKIHAKGVIVDGKETFIGSINWTENSFKGNREVGILIRHPKVAQYYISLFRRDWVYSRIFQAVVIDHDAKVYAKPNKKSRVLRVYPVGDGLDVLSETGDFYQVRLHEKLFGYVSKKNHQPTMTSYEARFQVGRYGVVKGRVFAVRENAKMYRIYMDEPHKGGFIAILWKSSAKPLEAKWGDLAKRLNGAQVEIKGLVVTYRNAPQIVIRQAKQLKILEPEPPTP